MSVGDPRDPPSVEGRDPTSPDLGRPPAAEAAGPSPFANLLEEARDLPTDGMETDGDDATLAVSGAELERVRRHRAKPLESGAVPADQTLIDGQMLDAEAKEPDLAATLSLEPVSRAHQSPYVAVASTIPTKPRVEDLSPPEGRDPTRILAPVEARNPEVPERIQGFEVHEEIGSGGMAVVHRAFQPSLERNVAIKSLRREYLGDRELVRRFQREAAALAQLQHGNVVQVLDVLEDERGGRHIVMELVDGVDLFDLLEAAETMPADMVALIAHQTAAGLEHAHLRGIVHRDIKPSNIFVSKRGEVKLMDFGIARAFSSSELTQVGLSVGTPAYMAPEQIRGEPVDARTDQFALGIVLYELLCGEPPWPERQGANVALDVLRKPHQPLIERCPGAPKALVDIVERCLEKSPDARWSSSYALRRALEDLVHERVPMDPQGRLVGYLADMGFVSAEEAAKLSPTTTLDLPGPAKGPRLTRRQLERVVGPIAVAHALGLVVIVAAAVVSAASPLGESLPDRPRLRVEPAQAALLAPPSEDEEEVKASTRTRPAKVQSSEASSAEKKRARAKRKRKARRRARRRTSKR